MFYYLTSDELGATKTKSKAKKKVAPKSKKVTSGSMGVNLKKPKLIAEGSMSLKGIAVGSRVKIVATFVSSALQTVSMVSPIAMIYNGYKRYSNSSNTQALKNAFRDSGYFEDVNVTTSTGAGSVEINATLSYKFSSVAAIESTAKGLITKTVGSIQTIDAVITKDAGGNDTGKDISNAPRNTTRRKTNNQDSTSPNVNINYTSPNKNDSGLFGDMFSGGLFGNLGTALGLSTPVVGLAAVVLVIIILRK